MKNAILAATFLILIVLSSCTVAVPLGVGGSIAFQKNKSKSHLYPGFSNAYEGLTPDSLKTRDDVSFTFSNDTTVNFINKNDGATYVFQWESKKGNARKNKPGVHSTETPPPLPTTLSFHFEGDSVVAWESQGIKLNAMTTKKKVIVGCVVGFAVGVGLDVLFWVSAFQSWNPFPGGLVNL